MSSKPLSTPSCFTRSSLWILALSSTIVLLGKRLANSVKNYKISSVLKKLCLTLLCTILPLFASAHAKFTSSQQFSDVPLALLR